MKLLFPYTISKAGHENVKWVRPKIARTVAFNDLRTSFRIWSTLSEWIVDIVVLYIYIYIYIFSGPGSSVGIVTHYGLDVPGSRDGIFRPSRPALEPTQPPVQ